MLLKKIFNVILSFLDNLIPDAEQSEGVEVFSSVFEQFVPILTNGIAILRMFLGSTALQVLSLFLGVIVFLNFFYMGYSIVMWIVSKIPFLGIK